MKKNSKNNKNNNKNQKSWYFLLIVLASYLLIYFIYPVKAKTILFNFIKLFLQILPILLLVYLILLLINYFINNDFLKKSFSENANWKTWALVIVSGIISAGPIYVWYPLLKDLKAKGIKDRFLASFLYNRGIKLQWAPILISYFGWIYSLILLLVMAIVSIPQGIITEKLINRQEINKLKVQNKNLI